MENLYCIHRSKDEERYNKLEIELNKTGLKPVFVEPEPLDHSFVPKRNFNREMNSLRETTIKLIEKAIDDDLDYIAIMEDDCVFDKNALDRLEAVGLPDVFDFVNLSSSGTPLLNFKGPVKNMFYNISRSLSCQFYIINKMVYKNYLNLLKKNHYPIDEITSYIHSTRGMSYLVQPEPVSHTPNRHSTLRNKKVTY